nr:HD domain-containing protein [Kribbella albertanoniae]
MGVLKRLRRAGWWHVGVGDPESVAEHSLRVAQLAALIAAEEGGDPARAAYLGMWHDSQETRIGDIPHSARPYIEAAPNERITEAKSQVSPRTQPRASARQSQSTKPKTPSKPAVPQTPTASSASCKPSNTANPATPESTAGSNPHDPGSRPSSANVSRTRPSPSRLSPGATASARN